MMRLQRPAWLRYIASRVEGEAGGGREWIIPLGALASERQREWRKGFEGCEPEVAEPRGGVSFQPAAISYEQWAPAAARLFGMRFPAERIFCKYKRVRPLYSGWNCRRNDDQLAVM